jgi:hypothetical protein
MKKVFYVCLCALLIIAYSCKKDPVEKNTVLNIMSVSVALVIKHENHVFPAPYCFVMYGLSGCTTLFYIIS